MINFNFGKDKNFPCYTIQKITVKIFIKAVDLLSKFPLFVVSVWISPESEVLSNSLFFVGKPANRKLAFESCDHIDQSEASD